MQPDGAHPSVEFGYGVRLVDEALADAVDDLGEGGGVGLTEDGGVIVKRGRRSHPRDVQAFRGQQLAVNMMPFLVLVVIYAVAVGRFVVEVAPNRVEQIAMRNEEFPADLVRSPDRLRPSLVVGEWGVLMLPTVPH